MKCKNCSAQIIENAIFCMQCGAPVFDYREAVERAQRGDQDAFSQLYDQTASIVYRAVAPMVRDEDTTQDILQDTYLKVFDKIGTLRDPVAFPAWVKQIGVRMALEILRKKKQLPTSRFSEMENEEGYMPEIVDDRIENLPQLKMDWEENCRLIREILDALTDEQRTVITLYYYHDKSIREIAEMIGSSEGTVKSRLHYGRGNVQKAVLEQEKRGVKLYSLTPLLFLAALLHSGDTLELSGQEKEFLQRAGQNVIQAAVSKSAEALSGGSESGPSGSKAVENQQLSRCPSCGSVTTVSGAIFCLKCGSRLNDPSVNGPAARAQPHGGDVGNLPEYPGKLTATGAGVGDAAARAGAVAGIGLRVKIIIAIAATVVIIAGAAIAVTVARDSRGPDNDADASAFAASQQSETDDDIVIESVSELIPSQPDDIVIEPVVEPEQSNGAQPGTSTGDDDLVISDTQETVTEPENPADGANTTGSDSEAAQPNAFSRATELYNEILQHPSDYDFNVDSQYTIDGYSYALVDMTVEAEDPPQLLLRQNFSMGMNDRGASTKIFNYDPAFDTVLSPDTTITSGLLRDLQNLTGDIHAAESHDGMIGNFKELTNQNIYRYRLSNDQLIIETEWSGFSYEAPTLTGTAEIIWHDLNDLSELDALAEKGKTNDSPITATTPQPEPTQSSDTLIAQEEARGRVVLVGTLHIVDYYGVYELQGQTPLPYAMEGLFTILVLDEPQKFICDEASGDVMDKPGQTEMLWLKECDLTEYDGKHVMVSVDPDQFYWPTDATPPAGEPRGKGAEVIYVYD